MRYVGIHTQQSRNNFRSTLLLCLFPILVAALIFLFSLGMVWLGWGSFAHHATAHSTEAARLAANQQLMPVAWALTLKAMPYAFAVIALWFIIAYFANTAIIRRATGSRPLARNENKRVYNLVENLCMSRGMSMPKINVIEDDSLNAFASGIDKRSYTVSLSRGIINKLDDAELEAVIAHELTHIRNRDVRLLIVSIVFVGIFSMLMTLAIRFLQGLSHSRGNKKNEGGVIIMLLMVLVVAAIGFFFASLMRFAISRKREYMADAGSAEMTHNAPALASALRKISNDPDIEAVTRADVAQLFIEHPHSHSTGFFSGLNGLFATHPPIKKRIEALEQF